MGKTRMENIFIIKDNRLCDEMRELRSAVMNRIHDNVCKLYRAGVNVRVCSSCDNPAESDSYIQRYGYEKVPGLYDRLVLEHNNSHPDNILHSWPRPNEEQ